jgi:hypothetical protein
MDLFLSVEDLQAKIQRYLGNPDVRIEAARRAQRRTLESHLYEHRAAAILDHVERLRASCRGDAAADRSPARLRHCLEGPRPTAKLQFTTLPSGDRVAATRVRSS